MLLVIFEAPTAVWVPRVVLLGFGDHVEGG